MNKLDDEKQDILIELNEDENIKRKKLKIALIIAICSFIALTAIFLLIFFFVIKKKTIIPIILKNKILLITTGGTISCIESPKGLKSELNGTQILAYTKYNNKGIEVYDFVKIDSSIMTDDQRKEIVNIIWNKKDIYDAFIITHGTDSMAFTAAYLDCALKNFDKTIILTGSQLPIMFKNTDAKDNLNLAIETAADKFYGICIIFYKKIIPAKFATKIDTDNYDGFTSVTKQYIEKYVEKPINKSELIFPTIKTGLIYITPNLTEDVILSYENYEAVIALVFGAGGMLKSQEAAFDKLKENNNTSIYIKSQCLNGNVDKSYAEHVSKKYINIVNTSNEWALYGVMFGLI